MNLWLLLAIAILVVFLGILRFRLHAFLVLLLAGLVVASLTTGENIEKHARTLVKRGDLGEEEVSSFVNQKPAARLTRAFGETAGQVGIVIALASVIGACLTASGAAQVIVDRSLKIVGLNRAPLALTASSFVLGIPVFFDTVFYLMVPLARSLCQRSGKDYVLFILAIMAGGSIAHSLVPPTPGPLQVAAILNIDLLAMMLGGLAIGGLSSLGSLAVAMAINKCVVVPLRENQSVEVIASKNRSKLDGNPKEAEELGGILPKSGKAPSLFVALLPIALPVILIGLQTACALWVKEIGSSTLDSYGYALGVGIDFLMFVGNKNVALGISAVFALSLLTFAPEGVDRSGLVAEALESGGMILLITSAGGAFGAMLGQAGITEAIASVGDGLSPWWILPIAFLVTAAVRTVQGSATVAMITSAGMLQGFADPELLPFHPVYLAIAIGGGSKPIAWMTDSGFWLMCKMSGMTESEGLKTVSPFTIGMGLSTLFWTLVAAWLFPFC